MVRLDFDCGSFQDSNLILVTQGSDIGFFVSLACFCEDTKSSSHIGLDRLHEGLQKVLEGNTAKFGILITLASQSQS